MTAAFAALVQAAEGRSGPRLVALAAAPRPPQRRTQINETSPAEIDAFVEHAFHTMVAPGEDAPPTTRCTPGKSVVRERSSGEPAPAVSTLVDEGFAALRRGEIETARRVWIQALALDPSNRTLALNLRKLDTAKVVASR
jgi:hypothetical protein